jgi:hypothetical protein
VRIFFYEQFSWAMSNLFADVSSAIDMEREMVSPPAGAYISSSFTIYHVLPDLPGECFLRVLIRCFFSHFSVWSSKLCTSLRGRTILFSSFFAVVKCLVHIQQYHHLPLFLLKLKPACLQHLRQYRTHMKHDNYGRCVITSKTSL